MFSFDVQELQQSTSRKHTMFPCQPRPCWMFTVAMVICGLLSREAVYPVVILTTELHGNISVWLTKNRRVWMMDGVVSIMAIWCPQFSLSGCIQALWDGYDDGTWLFWKRYLKTKKVFKVLFRSKCADVSRCVYSLFTVFTPWHLNSMCWHGKLLVCPAVNAIHCWEG